MLEVITSNLFLLYENYNGEESGFIEVSVLLVCAKLSDTWKNELISSIEVNLYSCPVAECFKMIIGGSFQAGKVTFRESSRLVFLIVDSMLKCCTNPTAYIHHCRYQRTSCRDRYTMLSQMLSLNSNNTRRCRAFYKLFCSRFIKERIYQTSNI